MNKMDALTIGEIAIGVAVSIIGYFVKVIHNDVRQNTKDVGQNGGRLDNLNTRIEHEAEMRNTSYNNIMLILSEIKDELKSLKK